MPGDAALDLHIASKSFRAPDGAREPVLRDIRLLAGPGEFLALLAPSGTGKSTTLRIVLGLDEDFAGHASRPPGRLGVVFQEPLLAPWLTVAENIRLVVADGVAPPDIPAILDEVGLPGAEGRYPRELSLGMARRAALARALAVAPDLLVLDEPFASLDPQLAATLAGVVARWAARTRAIVILATHDLTQALGLANRILVLSGRPATLAADLKVPGAKGREAFRDEVLGRFPFLGTAAE